MEMPSHNGLGYSARPASIEHHRPRTLQRHHTIQNSDDAYVGLRRFMAARPYVLCKTYYEVCVLGLSK